MDSAFFRTVLLIRFRKAGPLLMLKKIFISGALCCLGLLQSAIQAAELLVPDDYPTIKEAYAAAGDGDTIRITDSGVYPGELAIGKRLNIVADPGVSPTIRGTTLTTQVVAVIEGGIGSVIGSTTGGQIIIDARGENNPIVGLFHTTGTVTYENISLINPATANAFALYGFPGNTAGSTTFRQLEVDMGNGGNMIIQHNTLTGTLTFEDSTFRCRNVASGGFFLNGGAGTINFTRCDVQTQRFFLYLYAMSFAPGGKWTINVDQSWIRCENSIYGNLPAIGIGGDPIIAADVNLTYSAIIGQAGVLRNSPAADNVNAVIDHCDLLSPGNSVIIDVEDALTGRSYDITNTNIIGPGDALSYTGTSEPMLSDYNNIVMGGDDYAGFTAGARDLSLLPTYQNPTAGDYRYPEPALLVGSSTNGPIGSNFDFGYSGTPPPQSVSRATSWMLY